MFRTIVAKYSGSTCKRCRGPISQGATIRYGGKGLTYHMAKYCGTVSAPKYTEDAADRSERAFFDMCDPAHQNDVRGFYGDN